MSMESDLLKHTIRLRAQSVRDLAEGKNRTLDLAIFMDEIATTKDDEEDLRTAIIFFAGALRALASVEHKGTNEMDIMMQSRLLLEDIGKDDLVKKYYGAD